MEHLTQAVSSAESEQVESVAAEVEVAEEDAVDVVVEAAAAEVVVDVR